jgi:hypothetical protein
MTFYEKCARDALAKGWTQVRDSLGASYRAYRYTWKGNDIVVDALFVDIYCCNEAERIRFIADEIEAAVMTWARLDAKRA